MLYLHMADSERAREGAERFRRMIRQIRFAHAGREIGVSTDGRVLKIFCNNLVHPRRKLQRDMGL